MVREDIRRYRKAWSEHQGEGVPSSGQNNRVAMTVGVLCLEDGARARDLAKAPFEWFYRRLLGQTQPVLEKLYDTYEYYRRMGRFRGLMDRAINLKLLDTLGMAVVGDPEHCTRRLRALPMRAWTTCCAPSAPAPWTRTPCANP
jgi:alkanesulfonate monooxygenase SsuD/methylene tetrahydromethanopterin reductase-like flavin-dependent oxidoreductase (luciferase family)